MSKKSHVSMSVIRRLPKYYRFLNDILLSGINRISSDKLANIMGLTAPQIRQDLNCFGGFGQQGYGYNVLELKNSIANILGIENSLNSILVGVGNLGKTIITHMDFPANGFNIVAAFDKDENIIGKNIAGMEILNIDIVEDFMKSNIPTVAVLCIPKNEANLVVNKLISLGISAFWNFSHYDLNVDHKNIVVENVNLSDSLLTLCYRANKML